MAALEPRDRIRKYEQKILAPYAAFSFKTRGRHYPQPPHPSRTPFQRDRDRVIHSAAFRRMEYKTQVFVNHEGDHYRTRLTHSIEVSQIARTVARALGLNEDLTEAISLVHDLGHTPFGHSGEDILNELMEDFGGFNHNRQSLRVVDILERRYPEHPGLNLTYEVREGIVKHESGVEPIMPDIFPSEESPTLEAALVDVADSIAYNSHDVDDGIRSELLDWNELSEVPFCRDAVTHTRKEYPNISEDNLRYAVVRFLVDQQVSDLISNTLANIDKYDISSLDDVRRCKDTIIDFSPDIKNKRAALKMFLMQKMYRHPKIKDLASQARQVIISLFSAYKKDPQKLHGKYKLRIGKEPLEIIICDFIAGMTDRYAYKMFEGLKTD